MPLGRVYAGSYYRMTHRSTIVTRVNTEEGVVGEAYAGDEDADLLEIDRIVREEIAPRLVGEDAFGVERCWELSRPATYDILRDRRRGLVACACVDAAIWDAVGKAVGQPLWRLWGGYRSTLPVIAIGGYYGDTDLADEVAELRELGVAGMALAFDVQMAHHEEPQVASHLLAAIPHGTFVEWFHPDRDPIWWNLVANQPEPANGTIALPDAPGLGWELDLDFLEAHRVC